MSKFLGQSLFKPQYFNAEYLHGATGNGRSGYWRLFYTQLQEQSLEKDKEKREQEQRQEAETRTSEIAETEPVNKPVTKPHRVKRIKRTESVDVDDGGYGNEPYVVERDLYNGAFRVERPDITPLLTVVSAEFRQWMLSIQHLRVIILKKEDDLRKIKAANDEEEENINLLLLAA